MSDDDDGDDGIRLTKSFIQKGKKNVLAKDWKNLDYDDEQQELAMDIVTSSSSSSSFPAPGLAPFSTMKANENLSEDEDDGDAEIQRSVARARRIALEQTQQHSTVNVANFVQDRITTLNSRVANAKSDNVKKENKLIFTDTTEFTSRLQVHSHQQEKVNGATMDIEIEDDGTDNDARGKSVFFVSGKDDDESNSLGKHQDAVESNVGFNGPEPFVATGMAATLALLKTTGEVGRPNMNSKPDKLRGRGRDKDQTIVPLDEKSSNGGVYEKLQYRDDQGRVLTQKEAFRQASYAFHGIQPGKKKIDMRLKVSLLRSIYFYVLPLFVF